MTAHRLLFAFAILGVVLAVLPRAAAAGEGEWLGLAPDTYDADAERRVWIESLPAVYREGAFGFLALRFENRTEKAFSAVASVQVTGGGAEQRYARSVTVPAAGRARVWLPLPSASSWANVEVDLGGDRRRTSVHARTTGSAGPNVLGVHAEGRAPGGYQDLVNAAAGSGGRTTSDIVWCDPETLAPDAGLLSGFDLVLVDCAPSALDAARQRALAQYVAAGGHLALLQGTGGAGPLAEMAVPPETAVASGGDFRDGRRGLGSWAAVSTRALRPSTSDLPDWLRRAPLSSTGGARRYAGPGPACFRMPLEIPGLGDVPVQAFFLLILLFAIVVGPLSYVYFKRRRRLPLLVFTVPALGFLAAALILLYGFLSEGFGIRGVVRSFTVLDQQDHTAVTVAGRTLYAGLSPSALQPSAGTTVLPPVLDELGYGLQTQFRVDVGAGGRIDGAALPSRMPTSFGTTTVGPARERLRFRRRPDGRYEVLHGPDFAPVAAEYAVLFHAPDGGWFASDAAGVLVPAGETNRSGWQGALDELLRPAATMTLADLDELRNSRMRPGSYYWGSRTAGVTNDGEDGLVAWYGRTWDDALPPGSYLARVRALPSLDDLGLDVGWDAREHVVFGILGEEDVVE